jgi:hypothetical protein
MHFHDGLAFVLEINDLCPSQRKNRERQNQNRYA